MIHSLILDIDGIILGHQEGIDFPLPTPQVQQRLQNLAKSTPISLCTVKARFAVQPIIDACGLQQTYHITDAGATLIHGSNGVISTCDINLSPAASLIEELRRAGIYTEWYSGDEYFALEHGDSLIMDGRTKLLGRPATLLSEVTQNSVSKIIALPLNEWQETSIIDISKKYLDVAALHWGINPSLVPRMAAFFTNPGATKRSGVEHIARLNKVKLEETLAMGDSTNDWTFMELCGYVATLGNGSPELKELVTSKGERGKITNKNVSENGLLDILNQFNL